LSNVALEPGKKYLVRGWIRGEQLRVNKVLVEIFKEKLDYQKRQQNIYAHDESAGARNLVAV
jgi:hypothetical protein